MNILRRKKRVFFVLTVVLIPFCLLYSFTKESVAPSSSFNIRRDLLVFLHLQKTGGSDFDRHIVNHLLRFNEVTEKWEQACRPSMRTTKAYRKLKYKKIYCPRETSEYTESDFVNNWYFSRQTFGWYCGLHADYTTLKSCLDDIKQENEFLDQYYMISIIREPIKRYVSEWNHVIRGSKAWNKSINVCNQENLLTVCYTNRNVQQITLDEFISCENNMANNRQTRMLAHYSPKNNCKSDNLLENAKKVLSNLKYFALNEYQELSQELFEHTFKGKFKFSLKLKQSTNESSQFIVKNLNKSMIDKIVELNELDLKLYEFAKDLFFKRLNFYRNK